MWAKTGTQIKREGGYKYDKLQIVENNSDALKLH
jgi:hypothetical protein